MSTQHTPGPWNAHHDHGWLVVESDNGDLYVKVEKGSAARKHMANARLIAAAPELLAALRMARESIGDSLQSLIETETNPVTGMVDHEGAILVIESEQDLINQIDAAIAKATGEPQ